MDAQSTFQTRHASRHLNALCLHFGRQIDAECDAQSGWVQFPFGRCEMVADADALVFLAQAEEAEQLDRVIEVMASHLDRFAFRETPDLIWEARAPAPDKV